MSEKNKYKTPWQIAFTWIFVVSILVIIFGILIGYKLFPNNKILEIGWWFLWVVMLPLILLGSFKHAVRGQEIINEEKAKKKAAKTKSDSK